MPTSPTAPLKRIQVFVDHELADRIQRAALDDERSQSATIRRLIKKALHDLERTA